MQQSDQEEIRRLKERVQDLEINKFVAFGFILLSLLGTLIQVWGHIKQGDHMNRIEKRIEILELQEQLREKSSPANSGRPLRP